MAETGVHCGDENGAGSSHGAQDRTGCGWPGDDTLKFGAQHMHERSSCNCCDGRCELPALDVQSPDMFVWGLQAAGVATGQEMQPRLASGQAQQAPQQSERHHPRPQPALQQQKLLSPLLLPLELSLLLRHTRALTWGNS